MTRPRQVNHEDASDADVTKEKVAQQFVKLFYTILNEHPRYLHQFYGQGSTIVITESQDDCSIPLRVSANDQEEIGNLLLSIFDDVHVAVDTATPQGSVDGSVILLVTGKMTRKGSEEGRAFVQALLLARQERGYYVRTDTLHVHSLKGSKKLLNASACSSQQQDEQSANKENAEPLTQPQARPEREARAVQVQTTQQIRKPREDGPGSLVPVVVDNKSELDESISENDTTGSSAKKSYAQAVLNGVCKTQTAEDDPPATTPAPQNNSITTTNSTAPPPAQPEAPAESVPRSQPKEAPSTAGRSANRSSNKTPKNQNQNQSQNAPPPHCPSDRSIFVCRLPLGVTETIVAEAFGKYGALLGGEECVRVRTGPNACYAFVTYATPEDAAVALQSDVEILGEVLVTEAWNPRPRQERRQSRNSGSQRSGAPRGKGRNSNKKPSQTSASSANATAASTG